MSRITTKSAREFARVVASSPAVAGFRPASAALAVAAAFGLQPAGLHAQPAGAHVIHGQAQFVRNGNNLVVTTRNGAGTSHSAIDWQSFSVPGGSITRFNQPSASSTSINRVVGDNPTSILGTLRSNGRLVLVNPAGIAVGEGARVDTAGFTASTLGMSDADALGGRLLFSGEGADLQVRGRIVARKGDVVLIAPNVSTGPDAVIESNGSTVLAAGQKVEITGRGLEGIHLQVQAPGHTAVNLGRLEGDAVGIFAGTLRHSGRVAAHAVMGEGGKVVLQALGDNIVDGRIAANGGRDGKGGSVDVLGERVGLMAGTRIEANGGTGGGSVRVGGDYQGANADVQNAARTYVDRDARIEADATRNGDGGRVIVWSDELTRFGGRISARGGKAGGDGGFAEVSGKQDLQYGGHADLRAPKGAIGTLLLDPLDVNIVDGPIGGSNVGNSSVAGGGRQFEYSGGPQNFGTISDGDLNFQLISANVRVTTSTTSASSAGGGRITLQAGADVNWVSGNTLSLQANNGIELLGTINATTVGGDPGGALHLGTTAGNITQGADSSITVDRIYATTGSGSVLLNAGTNNVNRIAGKASQDFRFSNLRSLAIGTVDTGYTDGSGGGINSVGATSASVVDITTAGTLTIEDFTAVQGGTVSLAATGTAAVVNVGAASLNANNGELRIV
ncbi:MAG TPA: filamentous hemagglutinin N-terminal domain-containing protein, partial [Ramlibacter sp.]